MPLRENRYLDTMPDTSGRPDLRGAQAELLQRAALLLPRDRLVVELAIRNRLTFRQLGQLMAVPSGTMCRRVHRLLNRLNDPLVRRLLDSRCPLPPICI
jgi:DNA-directed RNA polymerase specialized sigma24 family protein